MLVLTRKRDEGVYLTVSQPTVLRVSVASIEGNRVQLAFDAPPAVAIQRDEVYRRQKDRNNGAA